MIIVKAQGIQWSLVSGSCRKSGVRSVVFDENHFLNVETKIFSRLEQFIDQ